MKLKTEAAGPPPKYPLKKWGLISAALALVVWIAQANFIYVLEVKNGDLSGAMYPLIEENWNNPRLLQLGLDERLLRVVSDGGTEFEKIYLLRKWVHKQWKGETAAFYYPAWDAAEILKDRKSTRLNSSH